MTDLVERFEHLLSTGDPKDIEVLKTVLFKEKSGEKFLPRYFENHAKTYIDLTYENPTIYHLIRSFGAQLEDAGFVRLDERNSWAKLTPGKYYVTRGGSSLAAFVLGQNWKPQNGIKIVGAHADALTQVLKPNSNKALLEGYNLLGVAPYGYGPTWWDRDLGIGGRLFARENGSIKTVLVDSTPHPVGRISTLAPHFGKLSEGPFNPETQTVPVIGFGVETEPPTKEEKSAPLYGKHPLKLLRYISRISKVAVKDIVQWDLQLYDVQKGTFGGLDNEFVFAPRVDDRVCSYAAIAGLLEAEHKEDDFLVVGLFDNEEIGSATRQGARGQIVETSISRVLNLGALPGVSAKDLPQAFANSIILSADVTHLVNPNFPEAYLEHHKPIPNHGISVELSSDGSVATDSEGRLFIEELARKNGDPLQYSQNRNDGLGGFTIGPQLAYQTGATTVDVGIPQLSMHSVRAALGAKDIGLGAKFFRGFFE